MVMGGASFIPGVGWIVGGLYFLTNTIVQQTTDKSIGEHIGNTANGLVKTYNSIASWLSSVESALHHWRPRQ